MITRLITAAPALLLAAALLAAGIWAVVHSIRGASRTCDAILNDLQPGKEKPKP